jgi:hypothetical protein
MGTKIAKIWEQTLQKIREQKSGNKNWEQKLHKSRNKNYKNSRTKVTKI